MYQKLYDELYESGSLELEKTRDKGPYIITDDRNNEDFEEPRIPNHMKITCQCGLWEHMGMLCFFRMLDWHALSTCYKVHHYATRWTKDE
ncbi:unnamed protein product [Urochloa humidicola]